MLTEKDYCDYDTCVALKELGLKGYAHPFVGVPKIPLYSAQKWLREEKGIEVNASWDNEKSFWFWYISRMDDVDFSTNIVSESIYNRFEEALSKGIKEAVKILTNNRNEQSTKSTPDY